MAWLAELRKHSLVVFFVLVYLAADMIFIRREIYIFNLLPVLLLLIYLAVARLDILYLVVVFLTPLSVQLIDYVPSSSFDIAIPTEPLLFGIMILFFFKMMHNGSLDRRIISHPVTLAILFNLVWMVITSFTSSLPLVSFKVILARIWFLTTYYLLAILVFRKYGTISLFILCFALTMDIVMVYTIIHHMKFGLTNQEAAHFVMSPFFRDHTSYGAIIAMFIFATGGMLANKGNDLILRLFLAFSMILLLVALVLSYTRAAWISVLISLFILILTLLRIRFRYILMVGIAAFLFLMGKRTAIIQKMEMNRKETSVTLSEHVRSISNITTDESNLERINRWNSALRMFEERPLFGWGPGTYMFKYAPFQNSHEKTVISTNFGDLGNAHSEYIGPLAESGFMGLVSVCLIAVLSLITGFRVYQSINDRRMKFIVLGLILGFITYLVHGALNNFLDTDKASAPFWGFIAVFVSLDLYHAVNRRQETAKSK